MYVNKVDARLREKGRQAVTELIHARTKAGLLPAPPDVEFLSDPKNFVYFFPLSIPFLALVTSRMAAETYVPILGFKGLRLISTGNSSAVLAQAVEVQGLSPWKGLSDRRKYPVRCAGCCPRSVRDSISMGCPTSSSRVNRARLGLGVYEYDAPGFPDDDHRIRSRLHQPAELVLGALAIGNVADGSRYQPAFPRFRAD